MKHRFIHFLTLLGLIHLCFPLHAVHEKQSQTEQSRTEEPTFKLVEDFVDHPFIIKETLKIISESEMNRYSEITQKLIFIDPKNWRVIRQLPFSNTFYEFLNFKDHIFSITSANRKIEPPWEVPSSTWTEVLLSPLRMSQEWNLVDSDMTFQDWLRKMKQMYTPLKNEKGEILAERVGNQALLRVTSKGTFSFQDEALFKIESIWEISELEHLPWKELEKPLRGGG